MVRPAELKLSNDPGITVTGRKKGAGEFEVVLSAKKPALWTWLEFKGAVFSDNFFHLVPGRPIRVHVETGKSVSADSFRRGLVVKSLVDTYGGRT